MASPFVMNIYKDILYFVLLLRRDGIVNRLICPFAKRNRLDGCRHAEREHAEYERQAMRPDQIIGKHFDTTYGSNENRDVSYLFVMTQIRQCNQDYCRRIDKYRLSASEGVRRH